MHRDLGPKCSLDVAFIVIVIHFGIKSGNQQVDYLNFISKADKLTIPQKATSKLQDFRKEEGSAIRDIPNWRTDEIKRENSRPFVYSPRSAPLSLSLPENTHKGREGMCESSRLAYHQDEGENDPGG